MSNGQKLAGAVTNEIPVRIEFQPKHSKYCGPACAQMILSWFDVSYLRQRNLFKEIRAFQTVDNKGTNWSSSPDGLEYILNKYKPADYTGEFKLYATEDQIGIARRMVFVLFQYKVPCVALVEGACHWIVVYGFDPPDTNPQSPDDTSYKINGFYIRDPYHGETQGHIEYKSWKTDYADDVEHGFWAGKFVAICDPGRIRKKTGNITFSEKGKRGGPKPDLNKLNLGNNPIPNKEEHPLANSNAGSAPKVIQNMPISGPTMKKIKNPVNGKEIIDADSAGKYAVWVLKTRSFYNPKMLKVVMANPNPGESVLVEYLGRDDFYYLVPVKENNKIYSVVSITATRENYREGSFAMDRKVPIKFRSFNKRKIVDLLKKAKKYGTAKQLEQVKIHASLVWKPCSESLSPYMPFYLAKLKNRKIYIRIDGKVFPKLTQGALGF